MDEAKGLQQFRTPGEMRMAVRAWQAAGLRVGLVPTMGALHAGHLSLVERIAEVVDRVIVSIFVNPTQFGPDEDFAAYPRPIARDLAALADQPADAVYLPDAATMYPEDFSTSVQVGTLGKILEGKFRPGHFEGVATVVTKLLGASRADVAIFGEKDYQQLVVIRRLVRDLDLGTEILAAPIVREPDGLALSSRNAYLDAQARAVAPALYRTLCALKKAAQSGGELRALEREGVRRLREAGFEAVDYCTFRDPETLQEISRLDRPARLLAVARLAGTRLLDNLEVVPIGGG
ncbi:MAG: pantoate--beta-alanine ligase [Alphaproteobacteria bacterium]|nr:MAG: pantoate--beta-alanine ligase [Alphaproteobacteria bacterium]